MARSSTSDGQLASCAGFALLCKLALYAALSRPLGFRQSFRAAVSAMLLVWFTYYVNRPHPECLCSHYFLYGFLLIDLGRYLTLLWRRPGQFRGPVAAFATGLLILVIPHACQSIRWSWDPRQWEVRTARWAVPLSRPDRPVKAAAPLVGRAFLPPGYAADLARRAEFLRRKASGGRLIYFTLDSYLMPRLSGVLALQEFTDPVEAVQAESYRRLCAFVRESGQEEVYFDARDETKILWYGEKFRVLRNDLSSHYQFTGVDCGWEVWKRRRTG